MSLHSDEDLDDTLPGPSHSSFSQSLDIDGEISSLLGSLRLEENRKRRVVDEDDAALKRVHEKIHILIRMESDPDRRRKFKKAHGSANRIREELYNLRRNYPNPIPMPQSYSDRIQPTLQDVVNCSFHEDYRKVAIILGVVDSLAELIILEVAIHGTTPRFPQHKSIRKLIANALTNLTYGHGPSKKRLCSYPDFINTVVALFRESKNLVQVYAGLIRNLSWNTDSEMKLALNPCVSALAAAAVEARKASDDICVQAILCALWNLASHSTENKKAICDEAGCLRMLAEVLSSPQSNPIETTESASGILKYVSQYLTNHSDHSDLRPLLVRSLVVHLSSPSFTALSNVLGALGNLIAKDPHVQHEILCDGATMRQLGSLRDSNREDVSSLVKTVLSHLNQNPGYRKPYNHMSASLGVSSYGHQRDRLLNRAVIASPGNPSPMAVPQFATYEQQRCSSLPRHFARGGFAASPLGQQHTPQMFQPSMNVYPDPPAFIEQEDDELDVLSLKADKSNASRRSLESELPVSCPLKLMKKSLQSGWNSVPESVNTTANLSPVSPSDLPDSPTQGMYERERMELEMANLRAQGLLPPKNFTSNGSDLSRNGGSDAATAVVQDYPTPTFPTQGSSLFRGQDIEIENDYVTLDTATAHNHNLLQMSIEAALPPSTPRTSKRQKSPLDGAQLLAETIQSAMPQKARSPRLQGSEKLLQDCIQSAMPSMGATLPKNVKGGRLSVTSNDRQMNNSHLFSEQFVTSSVLFTNEEGEVRDAVTLLDNDLMRENSDDEFDHELEDDIDSTLPLDCLDEEVTTIDCSTLRKSRSVQPKPSRLPKPTYRPGVSPRIKPPVSQKPKPQTQAVITPYNYQKPKENQPSPEVKSVVHSGANTMLVTTV